MPRETEAPPADVRLFPPFRLDVRDERLWKGKEEQKLRRKPFAILRYLTQHPLRLVTQEELVGAVWGRVAMSESLLRTHVAELRRVLGEDIIETVVGRGYRFLREVQPEATAPTARQVARAEARPTSTGFVGRGSEMDVLQKVFETVREQKRQVVFVTGEPGIGKTTLVDSFLSQVVEPNGAVVASGSCVEQFGPGEAYLPVLSALGALCRGPRGAWAIERLARHAPTWLAQMPGLVDEEKLAPLLLRVQGATQARMLRELAETFEVFAADRPFVLVLEDMQWSDRSTIDLVTTLGTRREAASVLVLATCRPAELVKGDGIAKVIAELSAHRQAVALPLETWSKPAMDAYLTQRFAGSHFPEELSTTLHEMTGGNPLFAAGVLDDLESLRMIRLVDGQWQLAASVSEVASRRPDTVRQLIDIQIDRLASKEQRILEAASVAGSPFAAGAVAHALELAADEVDTACESLANDRHLLRFVNNEVWPDGTIQSHYAFVHALYRDAALTRIAGGTRRLWHRRIATGLEGAYGQNSETIAAELAVHFEEAQMFGKAVQYYCAAGERAMRRFGRADALANFNRARALVTKLPLSDESDRTELVALKHIGPASIALQGFDDPLLEATFQRTAQLGRKLGDDRALLGALLGSQRCHFLRGSLRKVAEYEGEVGEVLKRLNDPVASAEAAVVSYSARLFRGQLMEASGPITEACRVLDAAQADPSRAVNAPVVGLAAGHLVVMAWLRGAPDEAVALSEKMIRRAEALADPFHLSTALTIAALAHMWRREPEKTLGIAREALRVAQDVGAFLWQGRAMSLHHWAATTLDPQTAANTPTPCRSRSRGCSKRAPTAAPHSRPASSRFMRAPDATTSRSMRSTTRSRSQSPATNGRGPPSCTGFAASSLPATTAQRRSAPSRGPSRSPGDKARGPSSSAQRPALPSSRVDEARRSTI
jgi:DNA-binding winged helix-turn-helix (wHTH) protein